jgi:hypothetical protein
VHGAAATQVGWIELVAGKPTGRKEEGDAPVTHEAMGPHSPYRPDGSSAADRGEGGRDPVTEEAGERLTNGGKGATWRRWAERARAQLAAILKELEPRQPRVLAGFLLSVTRPTVWLLYCRTVVVNTSSIRPSPKPHVGSPARSVLRRLSVQIGWDTPPKDTNPS